MPESRPLPALVQAPLAEQAVALYQAARFQDALDLSRQALAQAPEDVGWLNIAAACARALGLHGPAETYWREAIRLRPGYAEAHNNLGILLKELKRPAEAESCYRAAIAFRPDYVEAHNNLALLLTEAGRRGEAETCYCRALELRPDSIEIGLNLVALLQERRDWDEVVACCQRVLERQPGCAEAYNGMGLALKELKRHGEAEASYRQALALRPDYVAALGNLGGMLNELKRRDEAEPYLRRAVALNPNIPEVHYNLGVLFYGTRRYDEAEACYRRALELRPGYVGAEWNLSALLLLLGRFEEGWRRYEIRYHADRHGGKAAVPDLPFPQWRGEALAGKSLVVWPEQGFGDAIQFCRYLRPLKRLGAAWITLVCKPPLLSLLRTLADADAVVSLAEAAPLPPHDYWMLALSAPWHCGTTAVERIPAAEPPYLNAPPGRRDQWAPKLQPLTGKRVGLVWKGSATNGNDAHRSLPGLEILAPLWRVPGLSFVSLQKGQAEDEAAAPPQGQPLLALGGEVRDFADSAAVLVQLDLLISVDTATAHLAGALGVPCWVMLPAEGLDWRWLLERSDSPWYPAMRLFRQQPGQTWEPVVAAIALELRRWLQTHGPDCAEGRLPVLPVAAHGPDIEQVVAVYGSGRHRDALGMAERALAAEPDNAAWLNVAGACCRALGRAEAAERHWRRALALSPDYVEVGNNLGILLKEQGRYAEAEASYRQAIATRPDFPEAYYNLGLLLKEQKRHAEAEASLERALALRPDYPDADWNLSLLLLRRGEYPWGWLRHEARQHPALSGAKVVPPRLPFPPWRGQPLAGKSLAIWPEQGLGDEIQFCRYVGEFKRRGAARITLVCKPPLYALFQAMPEVDAVRVLPEAGAKTGLPPHDYWVLAHSAPLYCGTTLDSIPARLPYLRVPPDRLAEWAPRLGGGAGIRVGLVWKGGTALSNDVQRSLPGLATLAPLWRVPGVVFVGLQLGQGAEEAAAPPPGQPLCDLGPDIRDFADTAAILAQIDLLISVDTAAAHLAGALDRPCWVLLPATGTDWRWLAERSDSPWYPGALRLFRQAVPGDWGPVVAEVAAALRDFQPGSAPPPRREAEPLAARLARLSAADFELVRALVDRLADPGA